MKEMLTIFHYQCLRALAPGPSMHKILINNNNYLTTIFPILERVSPM